MATIATQTFSRLVGVRKKTLGDAIDLRRALAESSSGEQVLDNVHFITPQLDALRSFASSARTGGALILAGAGGTGKTSLLYVMDRVLTASYPSDYFTKLCQSLGDEYVAQSLESLRAEGRNWLAAVADFSSGDFVYALRGALGSALLSCKKTCDFTPKAADLVQEYVETLTHLHLQGSIDGLVVLGDNFDNIFDSCLADGNSENAQAVREFIALCRDSSFPLLFVGTLRRDMSSLDLEEEAFLTDVFRKVQPINLLGKTGEWEELVTNYILCHPESELWGDAGEYKDFKEEAALTEKQKLYAGKSEKWITDNVVCGAYPLHPAALFALPRVAMSLRSGKKTAFRFFSDIGPGSFTYFLNNYAAVQPNGRLNMYTVDWLCTYFEKAIQEDKQNKFYTSALQNAILAAGDVPQSRRILRLVMILQLIGHECLRPQLETILWALHLGEREERTVRNSLTLLLQRKALEFSEATQEYLLPVPKRDVNVPQAVQRSRKRMRSQLDLRQELQSGLATLRIKADGFNDKYCTDRYGVVRAYVSADITDPSHFLLQADELLNCKNPYRGDILFAYIIPDSANDRDAIAAQIRQGKYNHKRVVMVLPREAHRFAKDILEVRTLERMMAQELPFSDANSPEHAQVAALLDKVTSSLDSYAENLLDYDNIEYYYNAELLGFEDDEQVQEWLDNCLPDLIGELPHIASAELMCLGYNGANLRSRLSLINHLLKSGDTVALHTDERVLRNMVEEGLVKTGVFKRNEPNGFWTHYSLNAEIPDNAVGLALKTIAHAILATENSETAVEAAALINPWLEQPYNLTPAIMEMILAVLLWRWAREVKIFKCGSRDKEGKKPNFVVPVERSAKNIAEMVASPQDWLLGFREVGECEKRYLQGICRIITVKAEHEGSFWNYTAKALLNWYKSLAPALREPSLIQDPELKKFNNFLATAPSKDKHLREYVEKKLPLMLGAPKGFALEKIVDVILGRLETLCKMLKGQLLERQEWLAEGLTRVFIYEDEAEATWVEGARRWTKTLSPETEIGIWQAEYDALQTALESPPECCLEDLVSYLGYPEMTSWTTDLRGDVIERMSAMRYALDWDYYCRGYRKEDAQEAAVQLNLDMMRASGFDRENAEEFLDICLRAAVWPESLESEEELKILQAFDSVAAANEEQDAQEEAGDWLTKDGTDNIKLQLTAAEDEDDDLQIQGLHWQIDGTDFLSSSATDSSVSQADAAADSVGSAVIGEASSEAAERENSVQGTLEADGEPSAADEREVNAAAETEAAVMAPEAAAEIADIAEDNEEDTAASESVSLAKETSEEGAVSNLDAETAAEAAVSNSLADAEDERAGEHLDGESAAEVPDMQEARNAASSEASETGDEIIASPEAAGQDANSDLDLAPLLSSLKIEPLLNSEGTDTAVVSEQDLLQAVMELTENADSSAAGSAEGMSVPSPEESLTPEPDSLDTASSAAEDRADLVIAEAVTLADVCFELTEPFEELKQDISESAAGISSISDTESAHPEEERVIEQPEAAQSIKEIETSRSDETPSPEEPAENVFSTLEIDDLTLQWL